jgi:hypothetical protein
MPMRPRILVTFLLAAVTLATAYCSSESNPSDQTTDGGLGDGQSGGPTSDAQGAHEGGLTGCARYGLQASGGSCGVNSTCTSFTCSCPGAFPKSIAGCTKDGCLVAGDCAAICAGDLGEVLGCSDTHTIAPKRDAAAGDAGSCANVGVTSAIELVSDQLSGLPFAFGDGAIYFTEREDGGVSIVRKPLSGGAPQALWPEKAENLAAGGTRLIWNSNTLVRVAPLGGGTPLTVYNSGSTSPASHYLAASGDDMAFYASDGTIYRPVLDGGAPVKVVGAGSTGDLWLSGGLVVYDSLSDLVAIPIAGGTKTSFAFDVASDYAVSGDTAYYGSLQAAELRRAAISGGGAQKVAAWPADVDRLKGIVATDGTSVYITAKCSPLYRIRISDGMITKLADLNNPHKLRIDGAFVYWVDLVSTKDTQGYDRYPLYRMGK